MRAICACCVQLLSPCSYFDKMFLFFFRFGLLLFFILFGYGTLIFFFRFFSLLAFAFMCHKWLRIPHENSLLVQMMEQSKLSPKWIVNMYIGRMLIIRPKNQNELLEIQNHFTNWAQTNVWIRNIFIIHCCVSVWSD